MHSHHLREDENSLQFADTQLGSVSNTNRCSPNPNYQMTVEMPSLRSRDHGRCSIAVYWNLNFFIANLKMGIVLIADHSIQNEGHSVGNDFLELKKLEKFAFLNRKEERNFI